jgi:peroxiredoxin
MKICNSLSAFPLFLITVSLSAQTPLNYALPSVDIKTLTGATVNSSTFTNKGKPIVMDFFATWCKPCVAELNAIAERYDYEQKRSGVKIILISIDSATPASGKVATFVRDKRWRYEVYLDPEGILQKAMQVMDTPATYIIDGNRNVVWVHNSYIDGDENKLFEAIDKLVEAK